jgi:hypothetical protein
MSWERFGYICRKASIDCRDDESIAERLKRIENEEVCSLYGGGFSSDGWPRQLFNRIARVKDERNAQRALDIYKGLSIYHHFDEPLRFKRIFGYLSLISVVFFFQVVIYQVFVTPTFMNIYESFGFVKPEHMVFYQNYWEYFIILVSLILMLFLAIGFELKKLVRFDMNVKDSFFVKHFTFRDIRKSMLNLAAILEYPVSISENVMSKPTTDIIKHLDQVDRSKICLVTEMNQLIQIEMKSLSERCEKQMKLLIVVIGLIIVISIFFFLYSAYSPLFIMGETV